MLERSFAIVLRAVESASSPVSGMEKLAMVVVLLDSKTGFQNWVRELGSRT
jgi:hypothetical protein